MTAASRGLSRVSCGAEGRGPGGQQGGLGGDEGVWLRRRLGLGAGGKQG